MDKAFELIKEYFKNDYGFKRIYTVIISVFVVIMSIYIFDITNAYLPFVSATIGITTIFHVVDYYTIIAENNISIRLVDKLIYAPLELTNYKKMIFKQVIKLSLLYTVPGFILNTLICYADHMEVNMFLKIICYLMVFVIYTLAGYIRISTNVRHKKSK